MKLLVFGMFIYCNDFDFIVEMIIEIIVIFGVECCMFGLNFLIEKFWCSYVDFFVVF